MSLSTALHNSQLKRILARSCGQMPEHDAGTDRGEPIPHDRAPLQEGSEEEWAAMAAAASTAPRCPPFLMPESRPPPASAISPPGRLRAGRKSPGEHPQRGVRGVIRKMPEDGRSGCQATEPPTTALLPQDLRCRQALLGGFRDCGMMEPHTGSRTEPIRRACPPHFRYCGIPYGCSEDSSGRQGDPVQRRDLSSGARSEGSPRRRTPLESSPRQSTLYSMPQPSKGTRLATASWTSMRLPP